jgi:hypothetical protein
VNRWLYWLVALLVVSCAPAPRQFTRPVVAEPVHLAPQPPSEEPRASGASLPPTKDAGYLVWEDAEPWKSTWYEVRGDELVERGTVAGIVIATPTELWRIDSRVERYELPSCAVLTNDPHFWSGDEAGAGSMMQVWSTAIGSQTRHALLTPKKLQKLQRAEHTVQALGSVGTTLFLHEQTLTYDCGPNEASSSRFSTLDIESGGRVEVLDAQERSVVLAKAGAIAREQFVKRLPELHTALKAIELVELRPRYAQTGELRLDALFATEVPFGLQTPDWSTNTATTTVQLDRVPRKLRSAPSLPIRLVHHPKRKVVRGFSVLTSAQMNTLTALSRRPAAE